MFSRLFGKNKKKSITTNAQNMSITNSSSSGNSIINGGGYGSAGIGSVNSNAGYGAVRGHTVYTGSVAGGGPGISSMYGNPMGNRIIHSTTSSTLLNSDGSEIVKLHKNGSVTWVNGIKIDEAAEAFSRSLLLGAEMQSGITKQAKLRMRDSVFEDIISIAKEKGSLTADELTYLLEASKIVEKLRSNRE